MNMRHVVRMTTPAYTLALDTEHGQLEMALGDGSDPFLVAHWPFLLVPEILGASLVRESAQIESSGTTPAGHPQLVIGAQLAGSVAGRLTNTLIFLPDRVMCAAEYVADGAHQLAHWHITDAQSTLHGDAVFAYVGKVGQVSNGQTYSLSDADINTASHNWSYNPLAPRLLLKRGPYTIGMGGTALAHDFGLNLRVVDGQLQYFRFNYGGDASPMPIAAGVPQRGPRLQIQVTLNLTDDQAQGAFTQAMVDDGLVQPRHYAPEESRWRQPWYCTWGDQMGLAAGQYDHDVARHPEYDTIKRMLTREMVLKAARVIREHTLNIGTFIIDDGWQDFRGDWNLNTQLIPDMRDLTDALHAMDFQVMLWWAPFLTEPGAQVHARPGFTCGPTPVHGETVVDYANPAVRAWLQDKLDLWFGNGPGCWNIDGVKLDFLAEKVYPVPGGDADWRGEERLMHHLFAMIHATMAHYHDAPAIWTAPYNPHLIPYYIALGCEERFDSDMSFLAPRPAMMQALCPGLWFSPHFNYHPDTIRRYTLGTRALGGIPQIGKVLSPDVTPEILAEIRAYLAEV